MVSVDSSFLLMRQKESTTLAPLTEHVTTVVIQSATIAPLTESATMASLIEPDTIAPLTETVTNLSNAAMMIHISSEKIAKFSKEKARQERLRNNYFQIFQEHFRGDLDIFQDKWRQELLPIFINMYMEKAKAENKTIKEDSAKRAGRRLKVDIIKKCFPLTSTEEEDDEVDSDNIEVVLEEQDDEVENDDSQVVLEEEEVVGGDVAEEVENDYKCENEGEKNKEPVSGLIEAPVDHGLVTRKRKLRSRSSSDGTSAPLRNKKTKDEFTEVAEVMGKKWSLLSKIMSIFALLLATNNERPNSAADFYDGLHGITDGSIIKIFVVLKMYKILPDEMLQNYYNVLEMGTGRPYLSVFLAFLGFKVNAVDLSDVIKAIFELLDGSGISEDHPIHRVDFQSVDLIKEKAYLELNYKQNYHLIVDFVGIPELKSTIIKSLINSHCRCVLVRVPNEPKHKHWVLFQKHIVQLGFKEKKPIVMTLRDGHGSRKTCLVYVREEAGPIKLAPVAESMKKLDAMYNGSDKDDGVVKSRIGAFERVLIKLTDAKIREAFIRIPGVRDDLFTLKGNVQYKDLFGGLPAIFIVKNGIKITDKIQRRMFRVYTILLSKLNF